MRLFQRKLSVGQKIALFGVIVAAASVAVAVWKPSGTTTNAQTSINQGDVSSKGSGVAIGHGNTIVVSPTPVDRELQRRREKMRELLSDYLSSHDGIPTTMAEIRVKAEPYINDRLTKDGEPWRYNGKTDRIVDLK